MVVASLVVALLSSTSLAQMLPPVPVVPVVPQPVDAATASRWVKITNTYRCMHGVGPVGWSVAAATDALSYVNTLTSDNLANSNSINLPVARGGPAGENLATGQSSVEDAVTSWYNEVNNCNQFPGCTQTKAGTTVDHFTALVWKGVTEIGCAQNIGGVDLNPIYICRYRSGNELGPWTANYPSGYDLSVQAALANRSISGCSLSSTGILYLPLVDPRSMYPWDAGATTTWYQPVKRKQYEFILAVIIIVFLICCCYSFYTSASQLERKGRQPFQGTLRNQRSDVAGLYNIGSQSGQSGWE